MNRQKLYKGRERIRDCDVSAKKWKGGEVKQEGNRLWDEQKVMEGRLWFRFSDQNKVPEPDHYLFSFDISILPQLYSLSLLFVSGQNNSFASLHSPRLMMIDMNTRESNEISRTDEKERNENREQGIQAEEQPSEESYTAREKILLEPYTFSHHIYSFVRKKRSSHLHGWLPFFLSCLSS